MKKVLIVLLFVSGVSVFGLDHGLISGFEVGFNIHDNEVIRTNSYQPLVIRDYDNTLFIELTTGYYIGGLKLTGTYLNTLEMINVDNYMPLQDRFKINVEYSLSDVLKVGFEHWCDHPVIPADTIERNFYVDTGYRKIYFSFYKEF